MKIIQVTTFFYPVVGGVEQHVLDLSRELIRKGHKVEVICSDSTLSGKTIRESRGKVGKIPISRCRTWFGFSHFYKIYPGLFIELMRRDFDVIHVHGFRKFEVYVALLVAKLKRKQIVVTTHNPFCVISRGRVLQFFVFLHDIIFGKIFTRFIDHVIYLTEAEVLYLKGFYIKNENMSRIPNGVSEEAFRRGDSKIFTKKYNIILKKWEHKVLWIGRLNKVKGLENLKIAVKQLQNVLFVFVGASDDAEKEYKKLYKGCKNVIFTGPIKHKDLIHAYAACDIFVLPSFHEAFGVVILESMAQGMPVISTNVGGPSEIINEQVGILQDPCDQWSWMFNIEKLLENRKLRRQMSEAAMKESAKYRWEKLADQVIIVYNG